MTASRSVTLVRVSLGMSQSFMASVNSTCQPLPLWKRQIAVSERCRSAQKSNWPRGASARAVTTSAKTGGASSMREITTRGGFCRPILRAVSTRKAAFRASDSIMTRSVSGRRAAKTNPGKPPPDPKSTTIFVPGGIRGASWAESRTCRNHTSSRDDRLTRLMAFCHRNKFPTRASSWASVSRETTSPSLPTASRKRR